MSVHCLEHPLFSMSRNVDKHRSATPLRNHQNHHGIAWQTTSSNGVENKVFQLSCCSWCSTIVWFETLHYLPSVFDMARCPPFLIEAQWGHRHVHVALIQDWMNDPSEVCTWFQQIPHLSPCRSTGVAWVSQTPFEMRRAHWFKTGSTGGWPGHRLIWWQERYVGGS